MSFLFAAIIVALGIGYLFYRMQKSDRDQAISVAEKLAAEAREAIEEKVKG